MNQARFDADVAGLASLAEPTRRALYVHVLAQRAAVSRDEAAHGVGVPRHKAKFHLDKLVDDGLLDVEFARRTGRQGPGAGRPAKLYRRTTREIVITLPERRYEVAGQLMARAISDARSQQRPVAEALSRAAHGRGHALAEQAQLKSGDDSTQAGLLAAALDVLDDEGYQARSDPEDPSDLTLGNCPFDAIAAEHTEVVCGMNLSIMEGLLEGLPRLQLSAVLDPAVGRCCVRLTSRRP